MGRRFAGNPTVDVPLWSPYDDQAQGLQYCLPVTGTTCDIAGDRLLTEAALSEIRCYLHLREAEDESELSDPPIDAYSSDEFRMYDFKVRRCARARSHDWTECPYAHPGEKARRRDPRTHHYSGAPCPEFRTGICRKGDDCEFSHGVFECWLHPARYRTQPCKDGTACRRRVCFFAHTPQQLRLLPPQPRNHALDGYFSKGLGMISSSPTSTLISMSAESPPISPIGPTGSMLDEATESLRNVRVGSMKSMSRSRGTGHGCGISSAVELLPGLSTFASTEEMYGMLNRNEGVDSSGASAAEAAAAGDPDFEWVSELVK